MTSGEPHVFIESKKEKFQKEAADIGTFSDEKASKQRRRGIS